MSPKEVLALIREKEVRAVDLRFMDFPGLWQHFSISAREFGEDAFTDGVGFDGSSIRGFQEINESDMLLMPDADIPVHGSVPPPHVAAAEADIGDTRLATPAAATIPGTTLARTLFLDSII